jgi:adenylosuccinate lyase
MTSTSPKPRFPAGVKPDPATLAAGRYGTDDMVNIFGPEQTYAYSLFVQGQAALVLSEFYPEVVSPEHAAEIAKKASLTYIDPDKIRELEERKGHDVIAINESLEGVLSEASRADVNKLKTSADTTVPAKALQTKRAIEIIIDSTENLRDIVLEKSMAWIDIPHMDCTHQYDALPTVLGRPFSYYAELLQSDLNFLKFVYENSLIGKWGDATGNHHSATALGVDGIRLQEEYCKALGLKWTIASAQLPGLEFEADVFFAMSRLSETMNNLAKYIAWGRSDDVNIFINASPQKKKGSSAMPHKDAKNGNPATEEQIMSLRRYLAGNLTTALANCEIPYARDLSASANTRINLEDGFKFLDHGIRSLANQMYWIEPREERCAERVTRSYGVVTAQQVMSYLTDGRYVKDPMARSAAHDLTAKLATEAWQTKTQFADVLLRTPEITDVLDKKIIMEITNPLNYIGQSKEIIATVYSQVHGLKTL